MKWFYKWLSSKIDDTKYEDSGPGEAISLSSMSSSRPKSNRIAKVRENDELSSEPITFKMFKANGGWAIEFRQYDHKNDRIDTSLYVVNDEEELGKHVSQIITMEALKR
jgi:hypothetical protein